LQDKLTIIGEKIASDARRLMKRVDTGRARDSITWATHNSKGEAGPNAEDGDLIEKPSEPLTVFIGSAVDYFPHLEFGTKYMTRDAPLRRSIGMNRKNVKKILSL